MPAEVEVTDTYEAAYYLLHKGKIVGARIRHIPNARKRMFSSQWYIHMAGVDEQAITKWHEGKAFANVQAIHAMRYKIKNYMKKVI